MKILIAEDEFTTRMMVQVSLENWGYDVLDAHDGKEALAVFEQKEKPRIVILDWEMPGVNGIEVCQSLKEANAEDPPYIILLTGRDSEKDILQGFDAGADDYITKPFSGDELRARVRVADRLVRMQDMQKEFVKELRSALDQIAALQGNVVVCEKCNKIEHLDGDAWLDFTEFIESSTDGRCIKVICPVCED